MGFDGVAPKENSEEVCKRAEDVFPTISGGELKINEPVIAFPDGSLDENLSDFKLDEESPNSNLETEG